MGVICDSCFKEVKSSKISDVSLAKAKPDIVQKFEDLSDETHFPIVEVGQSDSEPSDSEKQDSHAESTKKTVVGKKRKLSKQGVKVWLKLSNRTFIYETLR